MNKTLSLIGALLLSFVAVALVFAGLGVAMRKHDSLDPRDASVPFDAFLMTTAGIGIALAACRLAAKLGAAKGIEGFIGVFLSFFGIPAFLALILSVWYEHKWPGGLPPAGLVWFALAVLEVMAALVWLLVRVRRAREAVVNVRSQDERPTG